MEEGGIIAFSQEAALEWCKLKVGKTYQSQFTNAIQRLADVYVHGHILKEHIRFFGPLSGAWSQDLGEFLGVLALALTIATTISGILKVLACSSADLRRWIA